MTTEANKTSDVQAFPHYPAAGYEPGMTLRDYFAGEALKGMLSDPSFDKSPKDTAALCYRMAAAMMEERLA